MLTVAGLLSSAAAADQSAYELTWSGYRGLWEGSRMLDFPGKAVFTLNGEVIGSSNVGNDALDKVEALDWSGGRHLRITIPDDFIMENEKPYRPPYLPFIHSTLLPRLVMRGVRIEFIYRRERCDFRTFWYDRAEENLGQLQKAEFFLDGKSLGKGQPALDQLPRIQWGKWPRLLVMMFDANEPYPFRTGYLQRWPEFSSQLHVHQSRKDWPDGLWRSLLR